MLQNVRRELCTIRYRRDDAALQLNSRSTRVVSGCRVVLFVFDASGVCDFIIFSSHVAVPWQYIVHVQTQTTHTVEVVTRLEHANIRTWVLYVLQPACLFTHIARHVSEPTRSVDVRPERVPCPETTTNIGFYRYEQFDRATHHRAHQDHLFDAAIMNRV